MIGDENISLWKRVLSAVGELSEAVTGNRLEARLDHDIRMADLEIKRMRDVQAEAKAKRIGAKDKCAEAEKLQKTIEERIATLLRGRRKTQAKTLAKEAALVAGNAWEWKLRAQAAEADEQQAAVMIEYLERELALLRHQMDALRSAANLQRTQQSISATSKTPDTAREAASRMREEKAAKPKVVNGAASQAETADEILDRIQKSNKPPTKPTTRTTSRKKQ